MHTDLATPRRVLVVMYQRYLEAERTWNIALSEMRMWFPNESRPNLATIGNPGSSIRRLYVQRERAMFQLEAARLKLEMAKQRLSKRCQRTHGSPVLFLTYSRN